MVRHEVKHTDRISITGNLVHQTIACKVLEIGAGDYSFEHFKNGQVQSWIKVDFSSPCDVICDLNASDSNLPFASEAFDLVVCTEVIEHLLCPQQLLKEAHRVLTPAGKIIVSVPNITSLSYRMSWLFGRIPSCASSGNLPIELGGTAYRMTDGSLIGGHVIDFNLKRLERLLELTRFKSITTRGSGIIWHKQILPHWMVPPSLSSNIICIANKL